MDARIAAFVSRRWQVPRAQVRVQTQPLPGGLESSVLRARIRACPAPRPVPPALVVKTLPTHQKREADVYDVLWRHLDRPPAVRLFGRRRQGPHTQLYLEYVESCRAWPWSDTGAVARVCRELARFHECAALPREAFLWDVEGELSASAAATLEVAGVVRNPLGRRYWRRLGDLRRTVRALRRIRERLLSCGATVVHGDVHPGNVILRESDTGPRVLLIDWARARIGSPLEDLASWLHSLGCWEPEARRRHDTLVRAYLEARRRPVAFSPGLRADYWLASASNGLSGAIRYHLAVLGTPAVAGHARRDSQRALSAWERVIRRAAALLRTTATG